MLDTIGGILGIGLALGAGVLIGRGARPVAKGAIKVYMSVADCLKEYTAEAGESLQDLYQEAKAERDQAVGEASQPSESSG